MTTGTMTTESMTMAERGRRGGYVSAHLQVLRFSAQEKREMGQRAAWTRDVRAVDPEGRLDPAELARKVAAFRKLRMARVRASKPARSPSAA